jgi:hypothetical protein
MLGVMLIAHTNRCRACVTAARVELDRLGFDEAKLDGICANPATLPLKERNRPFVLGLPHRPEPVGDGGIDGGVSPACSRCGGDGRLAPLLHAPASGRAHPEGPARAPRRAQGSDRALRLLLEAESGDPGRVEAVRPRLAGLRFVVRER